MTHQTRQFIAASNPATCSTIEVQTAAVTLRAFPWDKPADEAPPAPKPAPVAFWRNNAIGVRPRVAKVKDRPEVIDMDEELYAMALRQRARLDGQVRMLPPSKDPNDGGRLTKLSHSREYNTRARNAANLEAIVLTKIVGGVQTQTDIRNSSGLAKVTVQNAINRLRHHGRVTVKKMSAIDYRYHITQTGEMWLADHIKANGEPKAPRQAEDQAARGRQGGQYAAEARVAECMTRRRAVLEVIAKGPAKRDDIAAAITMPPRTVIKHVQALRNDGLIETAITHKLHLHTLTPAGREWLAKWEGKE